jgi:protein ImuB
MRVACLYLFNGPALNSQTIQALAESCFRFTPQVAVRAAEEGSPDQAIFLDIGACHRLYSEQLLKMKLSALAKRFGVLSRVTLADSAAEAFALARGPSFFYGRDLPLEALVDFALPFGCEPEAEKKIIDLVQALKVLGLKNAGEFAHLPPAALASRFGKEAVKLSAIVRGEHQPAWPGFHPSPRILEKSAVENSESLEALGFVIKSLLDRTVARLCGRGERASILRVDLELVKWGRSEREPGKALLRSFKLSLPLAQGSVSGLLPIIQEYLSKRIQHEPLEAPVDSITIEILETVPSRGAQRDFFTRKEEHAEVWDALVASLAQKIGKERVFTAVPVKRYLPEKAFTTSLQKQKSEVYAQPVWPRRPTRLLPHPEPFKFDGVKVIDVQGPERLSGEWWNSNYVGFNRDYYRLKTASGEELWIFADRSARVSEKAFYLHGYFD